MLPSFHGSDLLQSETSTLYWESVLATTLFHGPYTLNKTRQAQMLSTSSISEKLLYFWVHRPEICIHNNGTLEKALSGAAFSVFLTVFVIIDFCSSIISKICCSPLIIISSLCRNDKPCASIKRLNSYNFIFRNNSDPILQRIQWLWSILKLSFQSMSSL